MNQRRSTRRVAGHRFERQGLGQDGSQANHEEFGSAEGNSQVSRRGFLAGAVGFVLGAASGAIGTYASEYAKFAAPPGEIADQNSAEPPVRGSVLLEHDESMQGLQWAFPFLISGRPEVERRLLDGVQRSRDIGYTMRTLGAADINITRCRLILEGRRNSGIQVLQIRAKGAVRDPFGRDSSLIGAGPEGDGELARLAFNLDEADPAARHINEDSFVYSDSYFAAPYFSDTTLFLARNEQKVFDIIARTLQHYVEWTIDVQVLSSGVTSWVSIGVNDEPLRTNALRNPEGSDDNTQIELADYAEYYRIDFEAPDSRNVAHFIRDR